MKRSKRRWRDRQDHARKEGVANKIDLTLRLLRKTIEKLKEDLIKKGKKKYFITIA
jgi:hypothetical protein